MLSLGFPATPAEEDATLSKLAQKQDWVEHHAAWQAAYENYRTARGDPWTVVATTFSADQTKSKEIAERQRELYKSRSGTGVIKKIRQTPGLKCCPLCGSGHPGTVDHYLPKQNFPEFSILPCNLLPACPHCNSGVKGETYRGGASPERFIHPYFDDIASGPVWFVEVLPPFEAARFSPRVDSRVPASEQPMVDFHLKNILGDIFQDFLSTQWSSLPILIHAMLGETPPESMEVERRLNDNLRNIVITDGINSWRAALMRGVVSQPTAIDFIATRIEVLFT